MSEELNNVKTRFLPIPESAEKGLEHEAKITDFEILKELGSGSFGNVYTCIDFKCNSRYLRKS